MLLMRRGLDRGYLPELAKYLFILDTQGQEEVTRRDFAVAVEVIALNFVSVSQYLGAYLGPQEKLEAWVKPQGEACAHGVRVLDQISQRNPQSSYAGLGMSLQLEWK